MAEEKKVFDFYKAIGKLNELGYSFGRYVASPLYGLRYKNKDYEQRTDVSGEEVEAVIMELGKTKTEKDLLALFQKETPPQKGVVY